VALTYCSSSLPRTAAKPCSHRASTGSTQSCHSDCRVEIGFDRCGLNALGQKWTWGTMECFRRSCHSPRALSFVRQSARVNDKMRRFSNDAVCRRESSMSAAGQFGRLIDFSIYGISTVGLAVSVVLAGFGLVTFPVPLSGWVDSLSKGMLLSLAPTGALFVFRYNRLNYDRTQREIANTIYSGCPQWMRTTAYSLMILGVSLFFLPAVFEIGGYIPHSNGSSLPSTTPGGFGLIAYTAFIAQLYSATSIAGKTRNRAGVATDAQDT
jgi:hypothetical protein